MQIMCSLSLIIYAALVPWTESKTLRIFEYSALGASYIQPLINQIFNQFDVKDIDYGKSN